jgi:hypothetical protein
MSIFTKPGSGLTGTPIQIVGYRLDTKTFGDSDKVSMELRFLKEGSTEPQKRFLDGGFLREGQSISADGLELLGGQRGIESGTEIATLIESMATLVPELAETVTDRNFTPIVGARVTLQEVINDERQVFAGCKKLGVTTKGLRSWEAALKAAEAKGYDRARVYEAGRRKDATDPKKSYNHTMLVAETVVELGAPIPKGVTGGVKAAGKKAVTKPATIVVDEAFAATLVQEFVAANSPLNKGELERLALGKTVTLGIAGTDRTKLRNYMKDDQFLAGVEGVIFADGSVFAAEEATA